MNKHTESMERLFAAVESEVQQAENEAFHVASFAHEVRTPTIQGGDALYISHFSPDHGVMEKKDKWQGRVALHHALITNVQTGEMMSWTQMTDPNPSKGLSINGLNAGRIKRSMSVLSYERLEAIIVTSTEDRYRVNQVARVNSKIRPLKFTNPLYDQIFGRVLHEAMGGVYRSVTE